MFEAPAEETENQAACQVILTNFPLAFEELSELQRNDPDLRSGERLNKGTW
jgi:hypothetical protein